jgi:hypothetical protein
VNETGSYNDVTFKQAGSDNQIVANINSGNSNVLDIEQNQNSVGTYNAVSVAISGSSNNTTAFALSGAAHDALAGDTASTLTPGDLYQARTTR